MKYIQGLTHFVLISFGITLKNLDFDVEKSRKIMYPMVEILMDFVGRLLHQDPHLYAMIQMNFEMGKVHEAFLAGANRLYELVSAGDVEGVMSEMMMAKKHFSDTERAQIDLDSVIEEKIKKKIRKKSKFNLLTMLSQTDPIEFNVIPIGHHQWLVVPI